TSRDIPGRLAGDSDLRRSLPALHNRFGCLLAAATLGPAGVLAWDGVRFHYASAFQVSPKDTTGAGDIFHAGFIFGLLQGWGLPPAARFRLRRCRSQLLRARRAGWDSA